MSRRAGPLSIDSVKTVYMLGLPLWIQFKDSRPPLELDKRAIQASAHFASIFQKRRGPSLKYCYLELACTHLFSRFPCFILSGEKD